MALLGYTLFIYGGMSLYLARINKRRREGKEDYKIAGMTEEEIKGLGDKNPRFVYTI